MRFGRWAPDSHSQVVGSLEHDATAEGRPPSTNEAAGMKFVKLLVGTHVPAGEGTNLALV